MSRRAPPNPAAERAAQNTQTIKSLLKLEGNKTCADCKRNKHPRWASWNLGIFVCIRCSGIHRGMGTHISRVKSVDLDAWTDEQLQSVLVWGNTRANKYWEAKLAPGHVPSETKIENFIRTKYESKRWVMEGPIPDPSTLDAEGDDDIPLNLVKEKHNIERSSSQKASSGQPPGPSHITRAPQQDLFGDDDGQPPARPSSAAPAVSRTNPEPVLPKQSKPADSLLGLDFFGAPVPATNRPSSALSNPGVQSRPDLKQSILSLYASAPRPQTQQQPAQTSSGFQSGMQTAIPAQQHAQKSSLGSMNDAFSGLNFSKQASPKSPTNTNAFANLGQVSNKTSPPAASGGSFFDTKPAQKATPTPPQPSRGFSSSSGFGAFDSAPGMSPAPQNASSGLGDLFDFATPAAPAPPPKQTFASPVMQSSVFNLSQPAPPPKPATVQAASGWGGNDAWGSSDAWGATKQSPPTGKLAPAQTSSGNDFGWGSGPSLGQQSIVPGAGGGFNTVSSKPTPQVSADEDFGGWSSAAPVATPGSGSGPVKPASGFATSEDLFSNVWE